MSGAGFQPFAVPSRHGPHVTMQAGVVHLGRYWTTTSADAAKVRRLEDDPSACVVVSDGGRHEVLAGTVTVLRPLRPWTAVGDPVAAMSAGVAVARLTADHVDQLVGYLEAGAAVPAEFLPHRRVLLAVHIDRSLELDGVTVTDSSGWGAGSGAALPSPRTRRARPLPFDTLPAAHRAMLEPGTACHLGLATPSGPVVLPAEWSGTDRFVLSAPALEAVGADLAANASAVFDRSASRRPDEKLGVLLRGRVTLVDRDDEQAVVALDAARVTTWDGFASETIGVAS